MGFEDDIRSAQRAKDKINRANETDQAKNTYNSVKQRIDLGKGIPTNFEINLGRPTLESVVPDDTCEDEVDD